MSGFDLILTSEEDENISFRLRGVDLEDGCDSGVEVIRFGLRSVENIDWVSTSGNYRASSASIDSSGTRIDSLRKTGALSKYSENFSAFRVALEMRSLKSGRNLAISYRYRVST